jgi:hypothetical protein
MEPDRMTLILLDDDAPPLIVEREPEGVARREDRLRDLLFAHPEMLPVHEIDPGFGRLVAVAKELVLPDVGRIDALLVDERGRLVVVECKLWRNPQARREVVGQILDYARALARFSYDDLQRQIAMATRRGGNVLYELVREAGGTRDEARFVDQVSRDLRAGRFLLLIVGDGITEGTRRIAEFLDEHAGLAFGFAMVEMAQYRFCDPASGRERIIVQPRLIARTTVIERSVIRNEASAVEIVGLAAERAAVAPREAGGSRISPEAQQQWRDFVERFIAQLRFDDPGQPPPRAGGLNWMRLPLPGPANLTLWRSKPQGVVGAFVRYTGSEGIALYERLLADREAIDTEFVDDGLPAPDWAQDGDDGSIALAWPSPPPWSAAEEARQMLLLGQAANRFVNSLRPRLTRPLED